MTYLNVLSLLVSFPPLLLLLHCFFIFSFKKWLGPIGTFFGSISTFFLVLFLLLNELVFTLVNGNYFFIDFGRFFFCLDLVDSHLAFCSDSLAIVCACLVLLLTTLALFFGVEYMSREAFINRLLYLLNFFATSVILLFFCYDFFLIILIWECIGLFSLLLVNFYSLRVYTIKASLKTFVFSRISDMFMFFAFILCINTFNTTDLSLLFFQIPFLLFHYSFFGNISVHFLTLFSFAIVTSGVIKAAQFFFHVWLPDAMEAPTPASALIHSSTLVVAGIFLIIRFSILFEFTVLINYYLALLGGVTLAMASVTATFQHDIKKLVAYSTISQIGYLVCGCGFCCYEEVLLYLIIHALNKAFLFILVGYLVHFFNGNTDMRGMGGSYLYSLDIGVFLLGVAINLAGLPYSAGFLGKELLLFQLLKDDFLSYVVRACWLVSFFFTPIYMFILLFYVVFGTKKSASTTYKTFWHWNYYEMFFLLINFSKNKNKSTWSTFFLYRFQNSLITSRTTVYILFTFWLFFFFFGDFLILTLLNYSSVSDFLPSTFFFNLKNHFFYDLASFSEQLASNLMFIIFFFFLGSFVYLLSIKFISLYFFFDWLFFFDLIMFIFLIFFFNSFWVFFCFFFAFNLIKTN